MPDSRRPFFQAFILSLVLHGLVWKALASVMPGSRPKPAEFIEISWLNISREESKRPETFTPQASAAAPSRPEEPQRIPSRKPLPKRVSPPGPKKRSEPPKEYPASLSEIPKVDTAALEGSASTSSEPDPYTGPYDVPAQALFQVSPEIPAHLREKEFKSYVRVRVDIEAGGRAVPSLRTASGNQEIDELVLAALRHWSWSPATRNGQPVSSTLYFKFVFEVK